MMNPGVPRKEGETVAMSSSSITQYKQTLTVTTPVTTTDASGKASTATQKSTVTETVNLPSDSSSISQAEFDQANQDKSAAERSALDQVFDKFAGKDGKVDPSRLKSLTQQLALEQASWDAKQTIDNTTLQDPSKSDPQGDRPQIDQQIDKQNDRKLQDAETALAEIPPGPEHDAYAKKVEALRAQYKQIYGSAPSVRVDTVKGDATPGLGKPYTVKPGDTMWAIAHDHKVSLADLEKANKQIKDVNLIFPGQTITIPEKAEAGIQATGDPTKVSSSSSSTGSGSTTGTGSGSTTGSGSGTRDGSSPTGSGSGSATGSQSLTTDAQVGKDALAYYTRNPGQVPSDHEEQEMLAYAKETASNAFATTPPDPKAIQNAKNVVDQVDKIAQANGASDQGQVDSLKKRVDDLATLAGQIAKGKPFDHAALQHALQDAKSPSDYDTIARMLTASDPGRAAVIEQIGKLHDGNLKEHLKEAVWDDLKTPQDIQHCLHDVDATKPGAAAQFKLIAQAAALSHDPKVKAELPALQDLADPKLSPEVRRHLKEMLQDNVNTTQDLAEAARSARNPDDLAAIKAAYQTLDGKQQRDFHDRLHHALTEGKSYNDPAIVNGISQVAQETGDAAWGKAASAISGAKDPEVRRHLAEAMEDTINTGSDLDGALRAAKADGDFTAIGAIATYKASDGASDSKEADKYTVVGKLAGVSPDVRGHLVDALKDDVNTDNDLDAALNAMASPADAEAVIAVCDKAGGATRAGAIKADAMMIAKAQGWKLT